ncbi:hypothetical protein OAN99_05340 [Flavobacteriaceae bacterium]|nr:hypothetical protein [Flavobacteriaceae bacterium]
MKKGLLSILAGALVLVGCQNYDDQFDNLESQISALASTVAGLSQVQSDLSALAGTVTALSSTVNGLGDTIDTAVADGLTDIQADINAIETAVADVASSEEVSALQDAVDASQSDLDELLANSSVFQGAITINSPATLDVYHQMGSAIAIVNSSVDITMKSSMDETKMQSVIDNILVTTQDFTYTSEASSISEMTFNNLSATGSLTVEQAGGYQFQSLGSATVIDLGDAFKSSVTKIDFRELTSVVRFETENVADEIRFTKAVECHLTKLVYYPNTSLTIVLDEGAALPLALDDVDANGDQENRTLSITGPDSVTIENWTDGELSFTDVKTVVVNGFEGKINAKDGVESLTANKYAIAGTLGADLETINLTGATDPDTASDVSGPAINLVDQTNVETLTLAGKFKSINVEGCNNLATATISADVAGSIVLGDTASGDGNSDLNSVTLTGAKATSIEVSQNADLESLTIDLTFRAGTATGAVLDGAVTVKDNASLESLTVSSDKIETLDISGNDDLTTLDFTGVTTFGATGKPNVTIQDNDLTATTAVDSDDTTATSDGAASTDLGSFTTNSGMATLKTYLAAVAADADATAGVYFDTVESYTNESDSESTDQTWTSASQPVATKVLVKKPETTPGKGATKSKKAIVISSIADGDAIQVSVGGLAEAGGTKLFEGGTGVTYSSSELVLSGIPDVDIARIKNAAHATRATGANVTIDAKRVEFGSVMSVSLVAHPGSENVTPTVVGERYLYASTLAAGTSDSGLTGIGTDDVITFSVGSNSVTAVLAANATESHTAAVADVIMSAWASKYGTAGTASTTAVASLYLGKSTGAIQVSALDRGSRGYGLLVALSIANSTTGPTSVSHIASNLDWVIGATRSSSDNSTTSDNIVITVESNDAGTVLDRVADLTERTSSVVVSGTGIVTAPLFAATYTVNSTDVSAGSQTIQTESRNDARVAEDGTQGSGDAEDFSRVHWLGS